MFNERIDKIRAILADMETEEGWADWCNMLGDWDARQKQLSLLDELNDLFKAGYYGTEETRYVIGEA